jgi:hypothetical protein
MCDLGVQPREVWKQPDQLPAEGWLGSPENTSKPRRYLFFVACLAVFAYVPLIWHSEPSILILILMSKQNEQKERTKCIQSDQVQEFKILGFKCQTSGTYAKRAKQAT